MLHRGRGELRITTKTNGPNELVPRWTVNANHAHRTPLAWVGTRTATRAHVHTYVRLCCLSSPIIHGLTRERPWGAGALGVGFRRPPLSGSRRGDGQDGRVWESEGTPFLHRSGADAPAHGLLSSNRFLNPEKWFRGRGEAPDPGHEKKTPNSTTPSPPPPPTGDPVLRGGQKAGEMAATGTSEREEGMAIGSVRLRREKSRLLHAHTRTLTHTHVHSHSLPSTVVSQDTGKAPETGKASVNRPEAQVDPLKEERGRGTGKRGGRGRGLGRAMDSGGQPVCGYRGWEPTEATDGCCAHPG